MPRMPGRAFFDSVGSVLKSLVHRYGMESKLLEYHLRRRWPEIAGEQIAAHTSPDGIRFRKLYLIVENSVWLHQLTFLKPTLLESIGTLVDGYPPETAVYPGHMGTTTLGAERSSNPFLAELAR